jgi:hypothetical protein
MPDSRPKAVEHGAALGVDVEIVTPDWLMQHRRLVRDYEARPGNSEA